MRVVLILCVSKVKPAAELRCLIQEKPRSHWLSGPLGSAAAQRRLCRHRKTAAVRFTASFTARRQGLGAGCEDSRAGPQLEYYEDDDCRAESLQNLEHLQRRQVRAVLVTTWVLGHGSIAVNEHRILVLGRSPANVWGNFAFVAL